jgi:hypothetical protein
MNIIDLLQQYKKSVLELCRNPKDRKFMEDSFTRWYFNSKPDERFIPSINVVNERDLMYANKNKGCHFEIARILQYSLKFFEKLKAECNELRSEKYMQNDHLISKAQHTRLRTIYNQKYGDYEGDKNKLIALYNFIGMNSIHMSIPPIFEGIELFGSPLNTHNPYCSPFEFEKRFSSFGSFFLFNICDYKETVFTANPPFDEEIMEQMADRLESQLHKCKNAGLSKTIIITIPVWDSKSQKKIGAPDYGMNFIAFDKLLKSLFFMEHDIFRKDEFPYWDYYKQKLIPVSFTHLIVLATGQPSYTITNIKKKWLMYRHTSKGGIEKSNRHKHINSNKKNKKTKRTRNYKKAKSRIRSRK